MNIPVDNKILADYVAEDSCQHVIAAAGGVHTPLGRSRAATPESSETFVLASINTGIQQQKAKGSR